MRLIHAICSNAVDALPVGRGVYSFFLDAQGRIQSDSRVFVDTDSILIDCEPEARAPLREHIESYIIMDDVVLEDVTPSTCLLAIVGPASRAAVTRLYGFAPDDPLAFARKGGTRLFRAPLGRVDGYWIEAPRSALPRLVAEAGASGAGQASEEECEALRVTAGVPRFGADFGPAHIPHETQQLHAVSFAKGCYTGQEIVERVRSQGRVRRLLVGLELASEDAPADLAVYCGGKPVGTLTSPVPGSLSGGRARGFAMVRREAAAPGTAVRVGSTPAVVVDVSRGPAVPPGPSPPL